MAIVVTAQDFEARQYVSDKKVLPYRLFIPKNYKAKQKYPLMLALHGAGERGNDNVTHLNLDFTKMWADESIQSKHPCFVLAPQCPLGNQWVNTPWDQGSYNFNAVPISENLAMVVNILDGLEKEFSFDLNRIFISGVSMGGYGAWFLMMSFPNRFAAALPVCGGGDPKQAKALAHIPTWVYHGTDDDVVPVSGSRDMVVALRAVGGKVKYTELAGVKHESWVAAGENAELVAWLFEQKRNR